MQSGGYASQCCAEGDGLHRGVLGREAKFCALVREHLAQLTMASKGSDGISEIMCRSASNFAMNLNVVIAAPDMKQITWESIPDTTQSGRIMVRWTPHVEGEHIITVTPSHSGAGTYRKAPSGAWWCEL